MKKTKMTISKKERGEKLLRKKRTRTRGESGRGGGKEYESE